MSEIVCPELAAIERLAELQLAARRLGTTVRLHNATPALVELIELSGLADVFEIADSSVEVDGQIEQREQRRVDEEIHPGDCSP